ncbi:MAG: hypothetical protein H7Y13_08175 [Sphingobacteriaceae bacterium]|nr:hypothetical protein [Sphingobacteriaceae bacterium]
MKKTQSVSPFLILLIPALLVIGYKSRTATEIEPEKQQASVTFQIPSLKGMIKAFF